MNYKDRRSVKMVCRQLNEFYGQHIEALLNELFKEINKVVQ